MRHGPDTSGNNLAVSYKVKNTLIIQACSPTPCYLLCWNETFCSHKNVHVHVYNGFTGNGTKLETIQMFELGTGYTNPGTSMQWNVTQMKRHEQAIHTCVWMDPKCYMVTETSQTQSLHLVLFYLCYMRKRQNYMDTEQIGDFHGQLEKSWQLRAGSVAYLGGQGLMELLALLWWWLEICIYLSKPTDYY